MKVLVACEFSGIVRESFRIRGHEAWSCDLLETEIPGKHITGYVQDVLYEGWDLMIAHPPCTHLAISGAKWFPEKIADGRQAEALDFVRLLMNAPIDKICIENPVSVVSSKIRKPDQIIQPYFFGDPFRKTTCLWLKNLPKLMPTNIVDQGEIHITKSGKKIPKWYSNHKGKVRSRTFPGFAQAMARQWGKL